MTQHLRTKNKHRILLVSIKSFLAPRISRLEVNLEYENSELEEYWQQSMVLGPQSEGSGRKLRTCNIRPGIALRTENDFQVIEFLDQLNIQNMINKNSYDSKTYDRIINMGC